MVDPFTLVAERGIDGSTRLVGYANSENAGAQLEAAVTSMGGQAEVTIAAGPVPETWGADLSSLIQAVRPLDSWKIEVMNTTIRVTGLTKDPALRESLFNSLNGPAIPVGYQGSAKITLGVPILPLADVQRVLAAKADCGPLHLQSEPAAGFGLDDALTVTGSVAATTSRVALHEALSALAGDRPVIVDTEVLNPKLCVVEAKLVSGASGGVGVSFGFADSSDANPGGRYYVGEVPVIDVIIPAAILDGYIWVSIIDVGGSVYHLLPNLKAPESAVQGLRAGATGDLPVRVAWSAAEAGAHNGISFMIAPPLGKSKIIVLHSDQPVFDQIRPQEESAESFADALAARSASGAVAALTIDSRILTTEER